MFGINYVTRRAFASATKQGRVGFFGLGNMGLPMVNNLHANGFQVKAYDPNPAAAAAAAALGVEASADPAHVARDVDWIVTCLPRTEHVDACLNGDSGIFKAAGPGTFICDVSTILPAASRGFAKQAEGRGMTFLDTPMSGGVGGAKAGTLSFMIGGAEPDFTRSKTVLSAMGRNIFHCGPPGAGLLAKLTNNLILGLQMMHVSEGLTLGEKLGCDPKQLSDIMSASSAQCHSVDTYNPVPGVIPGMPASNGYAGGFGVALMLKDLGLALEASKGVDGFSKEAARAHAMYAKLQELGYGDRDFGFAYQWIRGGYKLKPAAST